MTDVTSPDLELRLDAASQRRIDAARAGSTAALGELLELCRRYLIRVAEEELHSRVQAKAGASDLVQDAFLEAQLIFDRFEGRTVEELLAWLRAILLNKLDEFHRRYEKTKKRGVAQECPIDLAKASTCGSSTPSELAASLEERRLLLEAMDRLPPHYRQIVQWRQWDGLDFAEIARRTGRGVDAVRMLWWRALERLERELSKGASP